MYDVIVVGAGPAGSACAEKCAASGLSTLLLEKYRMPRDKPCGGMTSATLSYLVDGLDEVLSKRATHVKSHVDYDFVESHSNELLMFERSILDRFLATKAEKAGADFRDGLRVTGIDGAGGSEKKRMSRHVTVETPLENFEGKIVVDAAGINSPFFREKKKVRSPKLLSLMLEDKLSNSEQDEFFGNSDGKLFYKTYIYSRVVGYGWAFGKDGKINVGLGGINGHGTLYAKLFEEMLDQFPFELDRTKKTAYLMPSEVIPKLYDNRLLFVGDAGGFVDAMTGSGIEIGIKTALDAAATCRIAVETRDFSASMLSFYEQLAADEIKMLRRKTRVLRYLRKAVPTRWVTPGLMKFVLKHFSRYADTSKRKSWVCEEPGENRCVE